MTSLDGVQDSTPYSSLGNSNVLGLFIFLGNGDFPMWERVMYKEKARGK